MPRPQHGPDRDVPDKPARDGFCQPPAGTPSCRDPGLLLLHSENTAIEGGDEGAGQRRIQCQAPPRGRVPPRGQRDDRRDEAHAHQTGHLPSKELRSEDADAGGKQRHERDAVRGDGYRRREGLRRVLEHTTQRQHRVRERVQQDEDSQDALSNERTPCPHDDPPSRLSDRRRRRPRLSSRHSGPDGSAGLGGSASTNAGERHSMRYVTEPMRGPSSGEPCRPISTRPAWRSRATFASSSAGSP